jgi:hypothetical protein
MYSNTSPTPCAGNFIVRQDGIYEIVTANLNFDGNWDIYLRPVLTECQEGDIILVHNKDKMYKCEEISDGKYGFKKISLLTLLNYIQQLEKRLEVKIADLAGHVNDLIT